MEENFEQVKGKTVFVSYFLNHQDATNQEEDNSQIELFTVNTLEDYKKLDKTIRFYGSQGLLDEYWVNY